MAKLIARLASGHSTPSSKRGVRLKLAFVPRADLDLCQERAICKFAALTDLKAIAWWRVGLGKTRLALGLMALLYERHIFRTGRKTFVGLVVGRPAFEHGLRSELAQIGFDCQLSTSKNGWRLHTDKPTIYFVSFASLQKAETPLFQVRRFLKFVIVDELYLFANPKSERSRRLRGITEGVNAIGLSGSILPAGDNFAVWGQSHVLGVERRLAKSATRFRSTFQTSSLVDFKNGRAPCLLFSNKHGWKQRVFQRLGKHIDVQFPKRLNRTVDKISIYPLTNAQQVLIKDLADYFFMEVEGTQFDLKYTLQVTAKIRGILNGWVEVEPGRLHVVASEKVSAIVDQLRELHLCKEQCIVWCAFRNDIKHLASLLDFASLQMVGGRPFDHAAWRRKDAYITLATLGSGSTVNHFDQTPYSKFFSLTYKPLDLQQARGRTDRRSTHTSSIFYEFLQCDKSLDEKMYAHNQNIANTEKDFIRSAQLWLLNQRRSRSDRRTRT